jgi:hypothetical protein
VNDVFSRRLQFALLGLHNHRQNSQPYALFKPQVEPPHAHGYANEILTPLQHMLQPFRAATQLPFICAGGLVRHSAIAAVRDGNADAGTFGVT